MYVHNILYMRKHTFDRDSRHSFRLTTTKLYILISNNTNLSS